MNDDISSSDALNPQAPGVPEQQAATALERRALLRAALASGAVAGAGLPLAAHATVRPHCIKSGTSHKYHPTASAVGSIVGSVTGSTPPVHGHTCSHYHTQGNWVPATCINGKGRNFNWDACANLYSGNKMKFWVLFELAQPTWGSAKDRHCSDILHNYPTSDEAIWITALCNANKLSGSFSYTPSGVIDLYNSLNPKMGGMSQAGLNAKARDLFRDYLSQTP